MSGNLRDPTVCRNCAACRRKAIVTFDTSWEIRATAVALSASSCSEARSCALFGLFSVTFGEGKSCELTFFASQEVIHRRATFVAALLLVAPTTVLAQPAPPKPLADSGGPTARAPQVGQDERSFEEYKQKLLARTADRTGRLQQLQSCVQAATHREQLKACRPLRPEGMEHSPGE